jgi:hypothetical protein
LALPWTGVAADVFDALNARQGFDNVALAARGETREFAKAQPVQDFRPRMADTPQP